MSRFASGQRALQGSPTSQAKEQPIDVASRASIDLGTAVLFDGRHQVA